MSPLRLLFLGTVACLACGGEGSQGSGDAGGDGNAPDARSHATDASDAASEPSSDAPPEGSAVYPARHPPMPLVSSAGGPVLVHPRVVPVFYAGDPLMGQVVTFLTNLTTATYWAGATAEYGVGPLTITPPVVVPASAPSSIDDPSIQALVIAHLNGETADGGADGGGAWPTPDTDTIYALFFPETTSIALSGVTSCADFAGYHSEVTFAGGTTSYAVLARCAGFPLLPNRSSLDILTVATSHELAEASTDPFPFTNPAYASADFQGSGWSEATVGGEIGDMCVLEHSSFITPPDVGFRVQRVWSNFNASSSHDPCAPVPHGEVYFNAVPDLTKAQLNRGHFVDGIPVAPGTTATVTLHLFSDAKMAGPFTISVVEGGKKGTRTPPDPLQQLSFSIDHTTGLNGDVVTLKLTRKALAPGEKRSGLAFQIQSKLGAEEHSYWGIAGYE